jgi:predicted phosphodiesterase
MTAVALDAVPPVFDPAGVRLAFITDVHADLHALQDALAIAAAEGCRIVVCGGDVVDSGRYPNETIALLREHGIPTVRGNHERWAIGRETKAREAGLVHQLTDESLAWLGTLPEEWTTVIRGRVVSVTHARPGSDFKGLDPSMTDRELAVHLDRSGASVLLVGHTHAVFERRLSDGRLVANPGSLLRDPAPGIETLPSTGTMGILELPTLKWRVVEIGSIRGRV